MTGHSGRYRLVLEVLVSMAERSLTRGAENAGVENSARDDTGEKSGSGKTRKWKTRE